jgi:hypothetical protein
MMDRFLYVASVARELTHGKDRVISVDTMVAGYGGEISWWKKHKHDFTASFLSITVRKEMAIQN